MRPHLELWIMDYIFFGESVPIQHINLLFENNWWFFSLYPVIKKNSHHAAAAIMVFPCCFLFPYVKNPFSVMDKKPKSKSPELQSMVPSMVNISLHGCIQGIIIMDLYSITYLQLDFYRPPYWWQWYLSTWIRSEVLWFRTTYRNYWSLPLDVSPRSDWQITWTNSCHYLLRFRSGKAEKLQIIVNYYN